MLLSSRKNGLDSLSKGVFKVSDSHSLLELSDKDFIHHHRWREKSQRTLSESPPPQHQWFIKFLGLWEEDFYTPLALRLKILQ